MFLIGLAKPYEGCQEVVGLEFGENSVCANIQRIHTNNCKDAADGEADAECCSDEDDKDHDVILGNVATDGDGEEGHEGEDKEGGHDGDGVEDAGDKVDESLRQSHGVFVLYLVASVLSNHQRQETSEPREPERGEAEFFDLSLDRILGWTSRSLFPTPVQHVDDEDVAGELETELEEGGGCRLVDVEVESCEKSCRVLVVSSPDLLLVTTVVGSDGVAISEAGAGATEEHEHEGEQEDEEEERGEVFDRRCGYPEVKIDVDDDHISDGIVEPDREREESKEQGDGVGVGDEQVDKFENRDRDPVAG